VTYLDSSVALARLLFEPRAPSASFWQEHLVSSRLLEYEIWNRLHANQPTSALLMGIELPEMERQVLARTRQPWPVAVRTLDSLHLATIEYLRSGGAAVELASYDDRLLAAARAVGITPAAL
jgi:uncharacterized protein